MRSTSESMVCRRYSEVSLSATGDSTRAGFLAVAVSAPFLPLVAFFLAAVFTSLFAMSCNVRNSGWGR